MSLTSNTPGKNPPEPGRPSIVLPAAIVGLLIIGGALAYKMFQSAPPSAPIAPAAETASNAPVVSHSTLRPIVPADNTAGASTPTATASPRVATPAPAPAPVVQEPTVDSRLLMASLTALDGKGPISAEDAQKWKASQQQLVKQGASSVAGIREYLAQNQDISYAGVQGADQLGYGSLRLGLLSALGQIPGPESTAAMVQTLQTTVFPTDVAALAATLEQQSPGQYQGDVLNAVRSQLALAAQDQLNGANVGPLFQLLATAGANGTDVTSDLTQYGSKWPYYAAIELGNLPNGAGVASLIQLAQAGSGGSQSAAAQELAQLAPQNTQALNTLMDMAKQGQLSDAQLAQIAPYLGGRENDLGTPANPGGTSSQGIHIATGNQDYSAAEFIGTLSQDQISQRLTIVDQLLQSIPTDDTMAQDALQQQKAALTARKGK